MSAQPGASITPPFGYTELVPLQKTDRVLIPHGATPEFCRSVNALTLSGGEFVAAAHDYPLAFLSTAAGTYTPVAVLGLADRQNLFVNEHGEWQQDAYVPACVRRYPFCIARASGEGERRNQRLVCVEKAYVDRQGLALYDEAGQPSATWQSIERLLEQYENDLELTEQMCATLARLELFSPFEFQVKQGDSPTFTLTGMHRVDEKKLSELRPASHKALVTKGLMSRIYAHLHSHENFWRLYRRALARAEEDARRRRESIHR